MVAAAMDRFLAIQAFKRSQTAVFGDVNYANVVASYLYDSSFIGALKKIVFSLLMRSELSVVQEESREAVVFFYSGRDKKRPDYDYIATWFRGAFGSRFRYVESGEHVSPIQFLKTLACLRSSWGATKGYRCGYLQRLGVALLIAKYRSGVEVLRPWLEGVKGLVTFCDAHPMDNMLTQLARARGLRTHTNQHGQYRLLDRTNMSADAEAYANFVSDELLCWGEATRKEFAKAGFNEDRLAVTGWIRRWGPPPAQPGGPSKGVFGVMLNGDNGRLSNIQLIRAAEKLAHSLDVRYVVRLHPWSRPRQYRPLVSKRCTEINQFPLSGYLERVDFSLGHMSGAVIEVLHAGFPVYLLDDGALADVFRLPGLSYRETDVLAAAIASDRESVDGGRSRMLDLAKWYNDDRDQAKRIEALVFGTGDSA